MDNDEVKDIEYPGKTLKHGNVQLQRGYEPHSEHFENPTEASRKGNGPRPFMGHSGPAAGDPGIDRGQFSSRNVKQGPR